MHIGMYTLYVQGNVGICVHVCIYAHIDRITRNGNDLHASPLQISGHTTKRKK